MSSSPRVTLAQSLRSVSAKLSYLNIPLHSPPLKLPARARTSPRFQNRGESKSTVQLLFRGVTGRDRIVQTRGYTLSSTGTHLTPHHIILKTRKRDLVEQLQEISHITSAQLHDKRIRCISHELGIPTQPDSAREFKRKASLPYLDYLNLKHVKRSASLTLSSQAVGRH
ncbi:hypothetical protein BDR03DRAFT_981281 [Suillus americanus]|nr:hypothetical protein BDR03DRAFT_981281 [Suillus americanus]